MISATLNPVFEGDSLRSRDRFVGEYAQTNIQLLNQLRLDRYSDSELSYIYDLYQFGMQLFASRFRGSNKPFLAHLVGTASILASLHSSINVVAAGLLHAAYIYGEYGTGVRGMTPEKREQVRSVVGVQTEELIARYTELKWNRRTIPTIYNQIDTLEPIEREVLVIRLANELEDHLDLGVLYCGNAQQRREYIQSSLYLSVDMANQLGFPSLASALSHAFHEVVSAELPNSIRQGHAHSFLLATTCQEQSAFPLTYKSIAATPKSPVACEFRDWEKFGLSSA